MATAQNPMHGAERLMRILGDASLPSFVDVISLAFHRDKAPTPHTAPWVELVVVTHAPVRIEIQIRLGGVRDFEVHEDWNLTQITGLQLVDVRDRQLEGVAWELSSYENDNSMLVLANTAEIVEVRAI